MLSACGRTGRVRSRIWTVTIAVESRGRLLDKLGWGQVSRWEMIAVSQLNSGSERRSSDSHILLAALWSVLWIMYYAVAVAVTRQLLRLTGWSCRISSFATPRSDLPESCCGAWTPRRRPEVRGFAWGSFRDQGSAARGGRVPLGSSEKVRAVDKSVMAKPGLPSHQAIPHNDTSDCATTTPR